MKSPQIHPGDPVGIDRYNGATRANHWVTAICFVALALSGLAFYDPRLFFLTNLFGGGPLARELHPFVGVVLAISFFFLFLRFWRSNRWVHDDSVWVQHISDVAAGHEERLPEVEKFNGGQKFVFWSMSAAIAILFVSGILIWDEYFYALTSIPAKRIAVLAHSAVATLAIVVLIIHIYAAIWVKGSFGAMLEGKVTGGWAFRHHRKWLRRLTQGGVDEDMRPSP
jgi:formate dehydrogenase subunit gamma